MRIGSYVRRASTSKPTRKHPTKTNPKIIEAGAELEIKNINLEETVNSPSRKSSTPKEVVFKSEPTEEKVTGKKSSIKSTGSVTRASSTSKTEGLCDSCTRISKKEILCECKCRHHSEEIALKKTGSSEALKQRLSRYSSAILKEALLDLSSEHCHRRSRPDLIYEHSSRCKIHAARKHSGKMGEKHSGKLKEKLSEKSAEKTSGVEEKIPAVEKQEEDAVNKASESTIVSKHFVAPDLFKESSHEFMGKDDNEIIDVIEEEEEEKFDEEKVAKTGNANSSPDIAHHKMPESASYYFLKAVLNDKGEYRVSLARSDTFPEQYLMETKVEPLEKDKSQEQDSGRKKSKESSKSEADRRKSSASETGKRKSKDSSSDEADRRKSRESSTVATERKKSKESGKSEPERRKSKESPERGKSKESSSSEAGRKKSCGSSSNDPERAKSKSRISDSQKLDVLTYKIGRRSVIYWLPKYEVRIEIFDKNPLTEDSNYMKVFRAEHDVQSPMKNLTLDKEKSQKAPAEESRKASVESNRKKSSLENKKASPEGSRKQSLESRKSSSTEARKTSLVDTKKSPSTESDPGLLEPLQPRISVWQSSRLEMVKELNEVPKASLATEPILTFQTSASINEEKEKPPKKASPCRKMGCLKIFQGKKSKGNAKAPVPDIVITQPEEEIVESKRLSNSSKGLETNPMKISGGEISKIPRDSSPDDIRKDKPPKHNLSLRLFGGRKKAQKESSTDSMASNKQSRKNLSGPSYTVQHCSIKIDTTSMIIPMITEPTLYDFSAKMLKPKKASKMKLRIVEDPEKFSQKMEGGEDKLIHKKILQTEEPWHYDLKYTIKKIRPESCPTYHSQRTVVQQIVWPDGKNKTESSTEQEKSIKKLKKKKVKSRKRKISSAGAECQKNSSSINDKCLMGMQVQILEYYPTRQTMRFIILGQQKILQRVRQSKRIRFGFLAKIGRVRILERIKHDSIFMESKRLKICEKMTMIEIPQIKHEAEVILPLKLIEVERLRIEDVYKEPNFADEIEIEWKDFDIFDRQLYFVQRAQLEAMRIPSWFSFDPRTDNPKRKGRVKCKQKNNPEVRLRNRSSSSKKPSLQPPIEEVTGLEVVPVNFSREAYEVVAVIRNECEDLNQDSLDLLIPSSIMEYTPNAPELSIFLDRTEKFSTLFQEEEAPLYAHNGKSNAFTKSLDSIVLNLTEAMKAAIYWDKYLQKTEIESKNMMSKKSSVMISLVDYLESDHSMQERRDEKFRQTDDDKMISFHKFEERKKTSEVITIFTNTGLVNTISKAREKSSKWIECQKSITATATEIYEPPIPYLRIEKSQRKKNFILCLEFLESLRSIVEVREVEYENYFLIYFGKVSVKELEPICEELDESTPNLVDSQKSGGSYQIFCYEENDGDENLEFYDAVDFQNDEMICTNIIANLKENKNQSINYALTLLEDLVKENEKHKGKKSLNPKKIKESLCKLHDAFGLFEKRSEINLTTHGETKEMKCFSDILKVLESVTNLVKIQLKEKRMGKDSFLEYESAVSVMKGEDFEIQPRKLKEEMMETFGLLKAYSEKAKRLIKEFRATPKVNERKEGVDKYYYEKKCESFGGYCKNNVENIEF